MSRKIKFGCLLVVLVGIFACGGERDWLNGEYEGTNKLSLTSPESDWDSAAGETLRREEEILIFQAPGRPRLGMTAPLPDCNLYFYPTDQAEKFGLDTGVQYTGESNNGKKCKAVLPDGIQFEADIYQGTAALESDGEMVLKIHFGRLDSPGSQSYVYEFRGRKKGWF